MMRRAKSIIGRGALAGPVGLVLLGGCGVNVAYAPLNAPPAPQAARPVHAVEMWSTGRPTRPYVDVGLIEAQEDDAGSAAPDEIVGEMRKKAAQMGCDGLVLEGANDAVVKEGGKHGSVTTRKGYRGTCIVYHNSVLAGPLVTTPGADAPATTCEPICSPGYQCVGGQCQPLCNPACPAGAVCGSDRVCRRP